MVTNRVPIDDIENGHVAVESPLYGSFHPEPKNEHPDALSSTMQRIESETRVTNENVKEITLSSNQSNGSHPAHNEHLKKTRQYYRDMMLGVNDGLVSTLLLVAGVVGGGMGVSVVLLTAISGAIAGAISMFAGEFVATKSQNEVGKVMTGEIKLEEGHVANYHTEEMQELSNLLALIGIPASSSNLNDITDNESQSSEEEIRELRRLIKKYYAGNTDALLKIMIALELGVIDDEVRSPFVAGGTSFVCFFVGALPSTAPFALVADSNTGLLIAGIATGSGLLIVGAIKSWATRGNFLTSAIENLSITVAGGAIAYAIGVGFQSLMGENGA
ncbi:hypothetical protein ACHAWO_012002 [Cyclotella atomus]|uniref:Uncharacterized protein n=1 Tax=Cyclotella atomus TaxID=382360 RepID=A0ABD3QEC0_9STRA